MRRGSNDPKDRTRALLSNSGGLAAKGAMFDVTSDSIRKFLFSEFEKKGVDKDTIGFAIVWNPDFDDVMYHRTKKTNIPPFFVRCGYFPDEDDKKGDRTRYKIPVADKNIRSQLIGILRDTGEKTQVNILENDALGEAVAMFYSKKKYKWVVDKQMSEIELDPMLVLEHYFRLHSEDGDSYDWYLAITDAIGPGVDYERKKARGNFRKRRRGDDRPGRTEFTMEVTKMFNTQRYKSMRRNKNIKKMFY